MCASNRPALFASAWSIASGWLVVAIVMMSKYA
jgi:hypothetical protein